MSTAPRPTGIFECECQDDITETYWVFDFQKEHMKLEFFCEICGKKLVLIKIINIESQL